MRYAATHPQCEPEDSLRNAWAFDHSHYPRHVFPRAAEHAKPGCGGDGRSPFLAYCCRTAAKVPGCDSRDFPSSVEKSACLQGIHVVPEVGLEPTRSCDHRILSPARLPIPPLRRGEPRHYTNVRSSLDNGGQYARGSAPWYSTRSQPRSSQGAIVEPVRGTYQGDMATFYSAQVNVSVL